MARTGAIFFSWGPPVRGREMQGLEVFGEALQYYEELAKEGRIIGHREYFFANRDGGCMILEGLLTDLHQLTQEDRFLKLQLKAGAIVEDFTMDMAMGGTDQTVNEGMTLYTEALGELGIT